MIRVAVTGAKGRMGRMVIEAVTERPDTLRLSAATERPGTEGLGSIVAPGVRLEADIAAALATADVVIDFTAPAATAAAALAARERGVAMVVGTTGLDGAAKEALDSAAERVPVVISPNFSLGVNLLLLLAESAARALGPAFDLEVVELHHAAKRDAPSGTAIALAEALARGRGERLRDVARLGRTPESQLRVPGEIGVSAVRGGDVVGEHTAFLFGQGERIELTHRATSRRIFARGAVAAAEWIVGKPPGTYSMKDVLGLA